MNPGSNGNLSNAQFGNTTTMGYSSPQPGLSGNLGSSGIPASPTGGSSTPMGQHGSSTNGSCLTC